MREAFDRGQYSSAIENRLKPFLEYSADVAPDDWDPPCPTFPNHPGRNAYRRAGGPFAEGVLIEIAYAFEQATLHRRPPAPFPALEPPRARVSKHATRVVSAWSAASR